MVHGWKAILWLNVRHMRTSMNRAAHFTGADLVNDSGIGERVYQIYIGIFVAIACVLTWVALLSHVAVICTALEPFHVEALLRFGALVPLLTMFVLGVQRLRSSPLKFTSPDIAYLASSSVSQSAMMTIEATMKAFSYTLLGGLGGFLVGTGLQAVIYRICPLQCAIVLALLMLCSSLFTWLIGVWRLTVKKPVRRRYSLITGVLFGCSMLAAGIMVAWTPMEVLLAPLASMGIFLIFLGCCGGVVALVICLIAGISTKADMTTSIEESWLFAELHPLRLMAMTDMAGYEVVRRRVRLAARRPRGSCRFGDGPASLVAHATLSHIRQFEGVPGMLFWSSALAPIGTLLLLGAANPVFLVLWAGFILIMKGYVCEMTQVFRADSRNRLIRNHLPYSSLELFFFDSLPSFAVTSIIAVIATTVLAGSFGINAFWGALLVVVCNTCLFACGALDAIEFSRTRWQPSFEVGVLLFAVCAGACSVAASMVFTVFGALLALAILLGLVKADSRS